MAHFASNTYQLKRKILNFANKESSKKVNVAERFSRHLEKGTSPLTATAYLQQAKKMAPSNPVIHIDDSDVTKPDGYKFEALGIVRDGFQNTSTKNVYKKAITLQKLASLPPTIILSAFFPKFIRLLRKIINQPIQLPSLLWNRQLPCLGKATFAIDRGYDDNKMFLKLVELKQDYVVRIKSNQKLFYHNRWTPATELRNRRKDKVKTNVFYERKRP